MLNVVASWLLEFAIARWAPGLDTEIVALRIRVAQLEETVAFYAARSTWQRPVAFQGGACADIAPIDRDGGERAREALAS